MYGTNSALKTRLGNMRKRKKYQYLPLTFLFASSQILPRASANFLLQKVRTDIGAFRFLRKGSGCCPMTAKSLFPLEEKWGETEEFNTKKEGHFTPPPHIIFLLKVHHHQHCLGF